MKPGKAYSSPEITVFFDSSRCIHAAECVRGLPAVFDTKARPWIRADHASAEQIMDVIGRCPSGALQYESANGIAEIPSTPTTFRSLPDGQLEVRGDLEFVTASGETTFDTRAILCTCSRSNNKPFCDNSHQKSQ
jgi:uncharacterized Fe-S cluster protein YjdI